MDGHRLDVSVPSNLPLLRADAARMDQVTANLLLNAALHAPQATPTFLTAGSEPGRGRVFFTAAERAPGRPPSRREGLFQKFQRGDAATAGGLGLGLTVYPPGTPHGAGPAA